MMIMQEKLVFDLNDHKLFTILLATFTLGTLTVVALVLGAVIAARIAVVRFLVVRRFLWAERVCLKLPTARHIPFFLCHQ